VHGSSRFAIRVTRPIGSYHARKRSIGCTRLIVHSLDSNCADEFGARSLEHVTRRPAGTHRSSIAVQHEHGMRQCDNQLRDTDEVLRRVALSIAILNHRCQSVLLALALNVTLADEGVIEAHLGSRLALRPACTKHIAKV
jgi:hypothetical protein